MCTWGDTSYAVSPWRPAINVAWSGDCAAGCRVTWANSGGPRGSDIEAASATDTHHAARYSTSERALRPAETRPTGEGIQPAKHPIPRNRIVARFVPRCRTAEARSDIQTKGRPRPPHCAAGSCRKLRVGRRPFLVAPRHNPRPSNRPPIQMACRRPNDEI